MNIPIAEGMNSVFLFVMLVVVFWLVSSIKILNEYVETRYGTSA